MPPDLHAQPTQRCLDHARGPQGARDLRTSLFKFSCRSVRHERIAKAGCCLLVIGHSEAMGGIDSTREDHRKQSHGTL
jgi:hypothetical protein